MSREIIQTERAPQAIGTYSQAVRCGDTVYLSGQIPLLPDTMELVEGDMQAQIRRVFDNLAAVGVAALPRGAQVEMDAVMELAG